MARLANFNLRLERQHAALAILIEDIEWMHDTGESPAMMVRRVDSNPRALVKRLERAGRTDLARLFDAEAAGRVA